jgi:hypothetical protein
MNKDEALKLALETLEDISDSVYKPHYVSYKASIAITAIKEALAQPAQEPVACMCGICKLGPTAAQPAQEPRLWVGLTNEESLWIVDKCRTPSNCIDMVEAKLKEKNS